MTRETLPNRRRGVTFEFQHTGPAGEKSMIYLATLGYYPDGRLAEIFIASHRVGSTLEVSTKEAAVLASFALQYGCGVETVHKAMPRDATGRPEGVMGTLLDMIVAGGLDRIEPYTIPPYRGGSPSPAEPPDPAPAPVPLAAEEPVPLPA